MSFENPLPNYEEAVVDFIAQFKAKSNLLKSHKVEQRTIKLC